MIKTKKSEKKTWGHTGVGSAKNIQKKTTNEQEEGSLNRQLEKTYEGYQRKRRREIINLQRNGRLERL